MKIICSWLQQRKIKQVLTTLKLHIRSMILVREKLLEINALRRLKMVFQRPYISKSSRGARPGLA